jgi:hypothetical protein
MSGAAMEISAMGGAAAFAGELIIAVNDVAQPVDFRAGISGKGRCWQCDASLRKQRAFYTGEDGLLIGLAWDAPRRTLFASIPRLSRLLAIDPAGQRPPALVASDRPYGAIVPHPSGDVIAGVHVNSDPGGKLVRIDPVSRAVQCFDVEVDGGRGGRHGVTGLALRAGEPDILYYVSEAGLRVSRYDIANARQLSDLHVMGERDARTYGLAVRDCGEVLMATGNGAVRLGIDGRIIQTYAVPTPRGWTRATLSADGRHFYLGNFMEGILQRRDIETGGTVAELDVGLRGALTALVEIERIS